VAGVYRNIPSLPGGPLDGGSSVFFFFFFQVQKKIRSSLRGNLDNYVPKDANPATQIHQFIWEGSRLATWIFFPFGPIDGAIRLFVSWFHVQNINLIGQEGQATRR
jgi:hypothetical protein